jgi:hypothetical protein
MEVKEKVNQISVSEGVNSLEASSRPFSLSERELEKGKENLEEKWFEEPKGIQAKYLSNLEVSERMETEIKFPDHKKLENFLILFLGQKEANEFKGQSFPLNAFVDWTRNVVKIFVTENNIFSKTFFEYWIAEAKRLGGN